MHLPNEEYRFTIYVRAEVNELKFQDDNIVT